MATGSHRAGVLELRVHHAIEEIPAADWNALLDDDALPFLDHRWLHALEASGSASSRWSWNARHLSLWRNDRLVAAAPAWKRTTTDGDFSRDWHWAEGLARAGIAYYPKLVVGVPYTPVVGRRFLVAAGAPGEDRAALSRRLVEAALETARAEGCVSVQVLFPVEEDRLLLEAMGWSGRASYQLHWENRGYRSLEDFLARFDAKRRHQLRREMAAPATQGIAIRTVCGEELAAESKRWAGTAFAMHAATVAGLAWGRPWLNRDAYRRIFSTMPERIEFVAAEREGRVIAGAFNVRHGDRLFGRYWGALERHPFLHFNVCYYHSIQRAIAEGIRIFEGGAGGDHKAPRGFEPHTTWCLQRFLDDDLHALMAPHAQDETGALEKALAHWREDHRALKR